jgi:nicotinamide phosphoribosyltransferase
MGSDTIAGVYMANKYYNCNMAGFSIPASEHSTMTMWTKLRESDAYKNMLEVYKDQPIFACVSDSYDIYNAAENIWGGELKKIVEEFEGTLVVRPDSGHPATVVSNLLEILDSKFGYTVNTKGYRVLNNVRVIQGDGVNQDSIREILNVATTIGYSTSNLAFGMGGALLQQLNRDTQKFAFKCSHAVVDNEEIEVYKDPTTDSVKKSKRSRLELIREYCGSVRTARRSEGHNSLLETVYENGEILREQTFDEIREISNGEELTQYKGWVDREV